MQSSLSVFNIAIMNYSPIEYKNLDNEVHIWSVDLDQLKTNFDYPEYALPEHEREKAKRFHFEIHRRRYIHGHVLLRMLIGRYLGDDFYDLDYYYNDYGKPSLDQSAQRNPFYFNLSNSENVFVCAFAKNADIGVDIEKIHDLPDMDNIVERFFAPVENIKFQSLAEEERKPFFFNAWARKEALLKAMGMGLSFPPDKFDILSGQEDTTKVIIKSNALKAKTDWTLNDIGVFKGFAAALALQGKHTELRASLRHFRFDDDIVRRREVSKPIYKITPAGKPSFGNRCLSCEQRRSI